MNVRIDVYVQPRASRTEVSGTHDGRVKIRLAAPPVDGAANAELVAFIAARLGIARSRVRVIGGASGRRKTVEIDDVAEQAVREGLQKVSSE
jgi:uncharacterized protein